MNSYRNGRRKPAAAWFATAVLFISLALFQGAPAFADDRMEADQLVEKAKMAFQEFMCDENMGAFRDLIRDAKGVMIVPALLKGAFVVGASGGNGVFLARDKVDGSWSGPAFYTIGGGSFGLQIGGQSSEVILLAMTDRGVTSFLSNSFKLGADMGVAVGPVGVGVSAATANLSADIVSFSRSKGLYGGMSLDGAVVAVRHGLNRAYFAGDPSPTDILVMHKSRNPDSRMLASSVAKAASAKVAQRDCASDAHAKRTETMALRK